MILFTQEIIRLFHTAIPAARRMEDAPYEEQDFKGAFMKLIKDRTGMGISGLYEEEMNDRKNGL